MAKHLKIGIDARFYGPTGKGLGRYTQEVVDNILKLDQVNDYVIYLSKDNYDALPPNPRVKKVLADVRWYTLAEQLIMPLLIAKEKLDLIHYPHFNAPLFSRTPFVVTIHDLILLRYPTIRASTLGPILYQFKNLAYRLVIGSAIRRSRHIIAVSEFTKQDILKRFRVNPVKISVTYEGVASFATKQTTTGTTGLDLSLKGINIPYLLYVGNAYPHKNLEWLIETFEKINDKNLQLVLVGKEDYFYIRLKRLAASKIKHDKIIFPGYISDEQLVHLFRKAAAYVFPSLYEGFGLPPLEAMASGCPVLAARTSCLPEILDDAALFFDPANTEDFRRAVESITNDQELRHKLIDKGNARAASFNWRKCAEETLRIYLDSCD